MDRQVEVGMHHPGPLHMNKGRVNDVFEHNPPSYLNHAILPKTPGLRSIGCSMSCRFCAAELQNFTLIAAEM
jgi:hypothetical protein